MRIDKFLADATEYSRREIHIFIKRSLVTINGDVIKKFATQINDNDEVHLNQQRIILAGPRYFMLNKPQGYVCANTDADHPIVLDLLNIPNKHNLQIAGRLDIDTTGLVLLTDDGTWNHSITSPNRACQKRYTLSCVDPIEDTALEQLLAGVQLHGEVAPSRANAVERLDQHTIRLTISEGKYHQVKRMLAATGNRVTSLHRDLIGEIQLDPQLALGKYRMLTTQEIQGVNHD